MKSLFVHLVGALLAITLGTTVSAQIIEEETLSPSAEISKPEAPIMGEAILEGIQLNFQGRHQEALDLASLLQEADPKNGWPLVLETYTLYWLMLYDDEDTRYDEPIARSCRQTIELADDRLDEDDKDAEAHFLKGQALMNLGRLHGWRGRYYQAGRDGERGRKQLERTLELQPTWTDAEFHLGMYYFFVSLIPDLVTRWLGWLWFVPTGNADEGILLVEDVAENGTLYREDALYMKGNILINFRENQRELGLPIIQKIAEQYPENVLLQFEWIEALYENGQPQKVVALANALSARTPRTPEEASWIAMAPSWKARAALLEGHPEQTLALTAPYVESPPEKPLWATAWVDLIRAQAFDVLGRREEALDLYRQVLNYESPRGSQRAARRAKLGIKDAYVAPRLAENQISP